MGFQIDDQEKTGDESDKNKKSSDNNDDIIKKNSNSIKFIIISESERKINE